MNRMLRALQAVAPNLVPAGGWFLAGWEPSTALIVYWAENLIASLAIGIRIALHRRLTRKRGHEGGFLVGFLGVALVFTLGHGLFLAVILFGVMDRAIDSGAAIAGIRWMLLAQLVTLAVDLFFLRGWPFAEIRARTDWMLGRVVMIHIVILFGMFISAGNTPGILPVFIALKTLTDITSLLPYYNPKNPPKWLARLANRFPKKGEKSFEDYWRKERLSEAEKHQRDEESVPL